MMSIQMRLIEASFVAILLVPCAYADSSFLRMLEGSSKAPAVSGLQISTMKSGKAQDHFAFGVAQAGVHGVVPMRADHRIRVASVSKIVVAMAVLALVEEQHFSLDDDASDLLGWKFRNPEFPNVPITVRSLLSHTSSVRDGNRYFIAAGVGDKLVDQAYAWSRALNAGTVFEVDDVIDPAETRDWVVMGLNSSPAPAPRDGKKLKWIDTW